MKLAFLFLLLSTSLQAETINLTEKQANFVAMKVWHNEGAGLDKYLIHWNIGEDFASIGIGHFIWFSEGHTEKFHEVFPDVVAFMQHKNVELPDWLSADTSLPWNSRKEFYAAKKANSEKYHQLFDFLKSTKGYQAEFLAQRLNLALPKILNAIEAKDKKEAKKKRERIEQRFYKILNNQDGSVNEKGLYALLDYVNFKGEGTVVSERYNHQGWGLLQVLEHLDPAEPNYLKAFAESADAMLTRRLKNSPPARGEVRWKATWHNRVMSYWQQD